LFYISEKDVDMQLYVTQSSEKTAIDITAMASFIAGVQKENGEIPWSEGGKTNPWDHVESAMGLSVAGRLEEAEKAYIWMKRMQLRDGSWWTAYKNGIPIDKTKDANISSYMAVGVYHHYLITKDRTFLKFMWPSVRAGIDFAIHLQSEAGPVYWAKNVHGVVDPMALLTASSSVFMSIKCGLAMAMVLGKSPPKWEGAYLKLCAAIKNKPHLFNMMKSRFSMDWYYPVLCGAVMGSDAHKRIQKSWDKFVVPGWGVRCVSDHPWTTMAETSELVLTLAAVEEYEKAKIVFGWLLDKKYDDGCFWMGVTFPDAVIWPEEKTAWTAAAVLLAYDALTQLTPASCLFNHRFWENSLHVTSF
jgi:hypothetical protein